MAGTDRSRALPLGPSPAVILVNPQLGENIGAAARAMMNCGLSDLRLVAPRDPWPNERAEAMASGATAILENARLYPDLRAAMEDLDYVYATTARSRQMVKPVLTPRLAAAEMRARLAEGGRPGILFGGERAGLENDDLSLANAIVSVPLNPGFSSLNLGQAVLLVGYEWYQSGPEAGEAPPLELPLNGSRPANKKELNALFHRLETELEDGGFFPEPNLKPTVVRNLRNMFQRLAPTEQELRTFHGVISTLLGLNRRD
jgi:tRNA/rRNA methyltransferase